MKKQYFVSDMIRDDEQRERDFNNTSIACQRIAKDRGRTGAEIYVIQKDYQLREYLRMKAEREFYQ